MTVERKKKFIINTVFFAMIIAICYVALVYLFAWIWPFLIGCIIAMILQRPVNLLVKRIKINRSIISTILVIFTFCVLGTLLVLIGAQVVDEVKGFISYLAGKAKDIPKLLDTIRTEILKLIRIMPDEMEQSVTENINEFFAGLSDIKLSSINFSTPLTGIWGAARQVPSVLISVIITFISTVFITADYPKIISFIKAQLSPKHKALVGDVKRIFVSTVRRMLRAYLLLMVITFTELVIGFYILKWCGLFDVNYIFTLAALIAIIDILPVLGVGTVLIPWSLISLITGKASFGIGLAVMYVFITILRNYLEPRVIGNQIGLNPLVTLVAMYIGLRSIGFVGMFLFPMIIIILKLLQDSGKIHLWKSVEPETEEADGSGGDESPKDKPSEEKQPDGKEKKKRFPRLGSGKHAKK